MDEATCNAPEASPPNALLRLWVPALIIFALTVGVTITLVALREPLQRLDEWSYVGAFLILLLNSSTVIFPAFGQAFIVAVAESLNPLLLALVGGVGAGLGELTAYVAGATGRKALSAAVIDRWLGRIPHAWIGPLLLVFAATPLPMDFAGLWGGSVRYDLRRFLVWTIAGKILNTLALAYIGITSVGWVDSWFD